MWIVMSVHNTVGITIPLGESEVALSWAPGMIGVLPVFDTKASADKYTMGRALVVEAQEIMPEHTA